MSWMSNNINNNSSGRVGGFSAIVTCCFTINYIIGTGVVTLPWAFLQGGTVLSTVTMTLSCIFASISCDFLLTSIARGQEHLHWKRQKEEEEGGVGEEEESTHLLATKISNNNNNNDNEVVKEEEAGVAQPIISSSSSSSSLLLIQDENPLNFAELCSLFLGRTGRIAYFICSSLYIFGILWAYSSVFGSAMAKMIPIQSSSDSYAIWVLIFASIVVPISCLEFSEQIWMQMSISACRILIITVMILTPIFAATTTTNNTNQFADQTHPVGAPLFHLPGAHRMLSVVGFSLIFQYSLPILVHSTQNKTQLSSIFRFTLILCGFAYALVGCVGAWYFGTRIEQSSNLNWSLYHGGTGHIYVDETTGEITRVDVAAWATIISVMVVCFPAIDVISAFPLDAIVLGNGLRDFLYNQDKTANGTIVVDRRITILFRCLATIPSITASLFIRQLGKITDYTGLNGLAILFIFPPLLYICSQNILEGHDLKYRTIYERYYFGLSSSSSSSSNDNNNNNVVAKGMIIFGVLSIVASFLLLITTG